MTTKWTVMNVFFCFDSQVMKLNVSKSGRIEKWTAFNNRNLTWFPLNFSNIIFSPSVRSWVLSQESKTIHFFGSWSFEKLYRFFKIDQSIIIMKHYPFNSRRTFVIQIFVTRQCLKNIVCQRSRVQTFTFASFFLVLAAKTDEEIFLTKKTEIRCNC